MGGLSKKGDKLKLNKKYFSNISRAYVYGKDRNFLSKSLPREILFKKSLTLKKVIENLNNCIKEDKNKKVVLFSPSAASFDQFKNFEQRGNYFNKLIKSKFKN